MTTSITDHVDGYNDFCSRAAADDQVFARFRSDPICRAVVDTLDRKGGRDSARLLLREDPGLRALLHEFRRNDQFGSPVTYQYWWPRVGRFCPATLRYVQIASRIRSLFGSLDGWRVAEIGVGYGGQARILSAMHTGLAHMALYDLPEVLRLAQRYLRDFGDRHYQLMNTFSVEPADYDLVISNYAFSELHCELQAIYLERLLTRARHGFMLFNQLAPGYRLPSWTAAEIATRLPASNHFKVGPGLSASDRKHGVTLLTW